MKQFKVENSSGFPIGLLGYFYLSMAGRGSYFLRRTIIINMMLPDTAMIAVMSK
jgi:hypothetical protein